MKDDLRLTPGGRVEHIDADHARPERHPGAYVSPLIVPPAHPSLAHLDTREGHEAKLTASLPNATAEQLDAAARHAKGEALRLVRRELLLRHLPIPLPTRRR